MAESATQVMQHRRLSQAEVDTICVRHDRLWSSRMGGARATFTWKDISGLNLAGRNLCDADFTGAILADCNFAGARLDNANMFGADAQGANFRDASLRRAEKWVESGEGPAPEAPITGRTARLKRKV